MNFKIWVYQNGENLFYKWRNKMPKNQVAKLEERIEKLSMDGDGLFPNMLSRTNVNGILKFKIQGNPKLRPLLCKGPIIIDKEYTLLVGAKEVSWVFEPSNALITANINKNNLISDNTLRVNYVPIEY